MGRRIRGQTDRRDRRPLRRRGERGANMVEFAFVAPVFLLIIFGVIDFGRAITDYTVIASSAREGARIGIIQAAAPASATDPHSYATIQKRVLDSSANRLTVADIKICSTPSGGTATCTPAGVNCSVTDCSSYDTRGSGSCCAAITVSTTYKFTAVTPLIGDIIEGVVGSGNPLTLRASSTMAVER